MSPDPPPTRATVLISGTGTNLQALIDARPLMPYLQIVRVISNKKHALGLEKAKAASIPVAYHNILRYYPDDLEKLDPDSKAAAKAAAREKYDADLAEVVLADKPDIVVCAGFMHILTPKFLDPLAEKKTPIINLHRKF